MNEKIIEIVEELRRRSAAAGRDVTGSPFLAIQFVMKDLDGGFYIEIKDDTLTFEAGDYPGEWQTELTMTSENFMKMIDGELNSLVAMTTGKLKIKGDLTKAKTLKELFKK
jgi:putative sterol carrier protein